VERDGLAMKTPAIKPRRKSKIHPEEVAA
jgi:hypothetical protein